MPRGPVMTMATTWWKECHGQSRHSRIGTSAGGVEALTSLASGFQANLPASVLVTIHLPSRFTSSLDDILSQAGPLSAAFATNGEVFRKARIYIAPPGRHL